MSTAIRTLGAAMSMLLFGQAAASAEAAQTQGPTKGSVQYLNPAGLHRNPGFSQAVVASGNVKTIYVGGQNSVDDKGQVLHKGDVAAQTQQALQNLQLALAAGGGKLENVVKWTVHMVQGQSVQKGAEAFAAVWGKRPNPPAVTVTVVAGLGNPDFLVEIDAIAVVPQ